MLYIFKKNYIEYSVNLDVTTYENGVRETHNTEGRVLASVMWDYYQVIKMMSIDL